MKRQIMQGLVAVGVALATSLATTLIPAAPAQAGARSYEVWFGQSGKCLIRDLNGYVMQWTCGWDRDRWYFDYMGEDLQHIPIWRIRNTADGWCLANGVGHNSEAALSHAPCAPDRDESDKWQLLPVEGNPGYYRLRSRQNFQCATQFSTASGAHIYQWDCHLGKVQYVGIS